MRIKILLLFCFLQLTFGLKCNVGVFSEIDNQMDFSSSDPVDCNGYCFTSYMNDGWYITYQLGCDSNGTYCKNSGCYDDVGKSTKICCCNNSDNCVDKDASSPVVYDLSGITLSSATAAYQVEGAAFEDGRGASI
ncbi:hypothetical protein FO519_010281, partial [Halicephalobus sp. NKZ332]